MTQPGPVDRSGRPELTVGVVCLDQLLEELLVMGLNSLVFLRAVPADDADTADIVLIASNPLDETGLREMEQLIRRYSVGRSRPVVLAIRRMSARQAEHALHHGLGSIIAWSESSLHDLGEAIVGSRDGHTEMPVAVLLALLGRLHSMRELTATHDWLTDRETEVIRMLADGLDTGDIAEQLNYSDRTIKSVVAGLCSRFSVHNRTHLVAFALRNGIL
jgi:DNA-binding NarL/FixJ family response regulator